MAKKTHRDHAVVLGAGMAGLLAARVLSEFYDAVSVVERDPQSRLRDPALLPRILAVNTRTLFARTLTRAAGAFVGGAAAGREHHRNETLDRGRPLNRARS
jgi:2-polyprenyl-6-methoxyphenol hydroxylase-like FAD-dependent oxidoreductase